MVEKTLISATIVSRLRLIGNDDDGDGASCSTEVLTEPRNSSPMQAAAASSDHDQISRPGGRAECGTGVVEHERPLGAVIDVDRVDGRGQRLLLFGDLLGELGAGVSFSEPRRHLHRRDHLDGRLGVGEVERPLQRRSGVVAPVETDDDALAAIDVAAASTRAARRPRARRMRRAVATHRAEPVVAEVTAATLADDQRVGRRRGIDQHVRGLALDDLRCHDDARPDVGDRHVEVVTRCRCQTEFVDAEAALRRHHGHHGGNVKGRQRRHGRAT